MYNSPQNGSVFLFRIHNQHAIIKLGEKKDKVVIKPVEKDCRILVNLYIYIYFLYTNYKYNFLQVNGSAISGETKLDHNDRIVVGSTHIWIFQNPLEKGIEKKHYPPITYEYAQEEIASKAGINIQRFEKSG